VVGGTFAVASAMGKYPYGVPYNVDGPALARILSRLPDINVVGVGKTLGTDGGTTVTWRVTFTYQAQGNTVATTTLSPLMVDPTNLVTTDGVAAVVCVNGAATAATATAPACLATDSNTASAFPPVAVTASNAVSLAVGSAGVYTYTIAQLNQSSADAAGFGVTVYATNREGWHSLYAPVVYMKPTGVPDGPAYAEVLRNAGSDRYPSTSVFRRDSLFPSHTCVRLQRVDGVLEPRVVPARPRRPGHQIRRAVLHRPGLRQRRAARAAGVLQLLAVLPRPGSRRPVRCHASPFPPAAWSSAYLELCPMTVRFTRRR